MEDSAANLKSDTLYHYCSKEAFLSILGSGQLWLQPMREADSRFLEGQILLERLRAELDNRNFEETERQRYLSILKAYLLEKPGFALCLTSAANSSRHWQIHAEGGKGAVLGFSRRYRKAIRDNANLMFHEQAVEYEDSKIDQICKEFCDHIIPLFRSGNLQPKHLSHSNTPYGSVAMLLGPQAFAFKPNEFQWERETRFLSMAYPESLGLSPAEGLTPMVVDLPRPECIDDLRILLGPGYSVDDRTKRMLNKWPFEISSSAPSSI